MGYLGGVRKGMNRIKLMISIAVLSALIVGLTYLGLVYYRPFHIMIEAFSCFIAFSIFIIAVNSYEITKNIPFLFLGIGFGFAGGFNIIHIIASNGMGFFQGDTTNLSMILSSITRFTAAISILICCRLFYKSYKMITPFTIALGFSTVSVVICILVFVLGNFPDCYVPGHGITHFKILTEYVISAITLISIVILFRAKKCVEPNVFLLLQVYLYAITICNILLNFYTTQQELSNVMAHILKLVSSYCIYRAVVKVGLKSPYKLLFNEIDSKNNTLRLKDIELDQTANQLKRENEHRRNIEEIVLKNEACYKLLIENSRDTIIIYNYERIIFANEGASALTGINQPEKLLGKTVTEFFPLNSELRALGTIKEKYQEEVIALPYETQIASINGKITPVEVVSAYVIYKNEPAILSLIRDISKQKQIEKMKKDNEEDKRLLNETLEFNGLIKDFFTNISHELRTPLNVILSALQVLKLDDQGNTYGEVLGRRKKYLNMMKQNCYRLLRLINNIIDISKIDSGYLMPHLKNYNIVNIVEDTTLSVAEYIQDKGVEFIFDTNVEEKIIACDPDFIERVMMNLLSNSVKFTEAGGQISVEVMDEGDYIQISVKDTGSGIPEDKLQFIFQRFRQVDNSLSRSHEGSGIGLSLVKALVGMHEGSISVKSTLGEGSEFIIKLPVRETYDPKDVEKNMIHYDNTERVCVEFSDIQLENEI